MKCNLKSCNNQVIGRWRTLYCSNECSRKDKKTYSNPLAKKGRDVVRLKDNK